MLKAVLIEAVGSAKEVAELFGITKGAVSQWGINVPPRRALELKYEISVPGLDAKLRRARRRLVERGALPAPQTRRFDAVR